MDLNTILIILGALTVVIFTFHNIWSHRQNNTKVFNKKPVEQTTVFSPIKVVSEDTVTDLEETSMLEEKNVGDLVASESEIPKPLLEERQENINEDLSHITISLRDCGVFDLTIEDVEKSLNTDGINDIHSPIVREQMVKNIKKKKLEANQTPISSQAKTTPEMADMGEVSQTESGVETSTQEVISTEEQTQENKVVKLYVVAPENQDFHGEKLQQAFEKEGFFFGDKNIYHFNNEFNINNPAFFSLAHLENDGTFNPETMADFHTFGLVLFMSLPVVHGGGTINLRYMINTAKSLALELNGTVLTDEQKLFDEEAERRYLEMVSK